MSANQVRAYAAATWPDVFRSPIAAAFATLTADDEASRAIEFAQLQAIASETDARRLRKDAMKHAEDCLMACNGWAVETLSHNIESEFGADLDADECDEIARVALARATGANAQA